MGAPTLARPRAKSRAESISKQLGGWIQSLLNSGMKGQRYVTEKLRLHDQRKIEREEFLQKLERVRRGERFTEAA